MTKLALSLFTIAILLLSSAVSANDDDSIGDYITKYVDKAPATLGEVHTEDCLDMVQVSRLEGKDVDTEDYELESNENSGGQAR